MKNEKADHKTILVIVIGLLVISFVFKISSLVYIATGIGFLSLLSDKLTEYILFIWMKIAEVLGWINTRILLALVFYIFVFPFSIIFKMITKNPLALKKSSYASNYVERNHKYDKKDLENIW
jgi:hypothetical protein